MKTDLPASLFVKLSGAAIVVTTLLVLPLTAQAQFYNTATGFEALYFNTTGINNTADGFQALCFNTTGYNNTATGDAALYSNTIGYFNTADGQAALYSNSTGYLNTATGQAALNLNTTGYLNTADGQAALLSNTTGSVNTAIGQGTLFSNTTGSNNTAIGEAALNFNTTGSVNTATGQGALHSNTTGSNNTADGMEALYSNTTGYNNTADGFQALYSNTTGSYNIALGWACGGNLTTGSFNIDIGNLGQATDNGVIRIGTAPYHSATYIAGISGVTASGGVEVFINSDGQLGTVRSSRRFKNDIKDMGSVSAKLMRLRPVTFRYKNSAEPGPHALQYGLIAEEVAKVYPDLVQYDKTGKPFTIYYHLLTPMLLNELQKEHRQAAALKTAFTAQNSRIVAQQNEIAALKAAQNNRIAAQTKEMTALKSELVALKQTQQQQLQVLAKLAACVQTSQGKEAVQKAIFVQH